jgi:hypothetical protein
MDPHGKYILPDNSSATTYGVESEDETSLDKTPPLAIKPLADTATIPSSSHILPSSSPPDSEFQLNCRCGFHGDGNKLHRKEEGTAIQCDECKDWSHVACQRNGRANDLTAKDTFICDLCSLATVAVALKGRTSNIRQLESKTRWTKPIQDRF